MIHSQFPLVPRGERPSSDFNFFCSLIDQAIPFTFIRFSDGETEILRNSRVEISEKKVVWSRGESNFSYPDYDFKVFNPDEDSEIRMLLIASAKFSAPYYFKGIPTAHNRSPADRSLMVSLNGSEGNLTFADLLINSNYSKFLGKLLPRLTAREKVMLVGNHRMEVSRLSSKWLFHPISDNAFNNFIEVATSTIEACQGLPTGFTVLCSASSLTNVIGHSLYETRPDLTFIDIGTALHPLAGMPPSRRSYLTQLEPWTVGSFLTKMKYLLSPGRQLKW